MVKKMSILSQVTAIKAFDFARKTPFFRRKLVQIAENSNHNIDQWMTGILYGNIINLSQNVFAEIEKTKIQYFYE
jgi:hypothetical protein